MSTPACWTRACASPVSDGLAATLSNALKKSLTAALSPLLVAEAAVPVEVVLLVIFSPSAACAALNRLCWAVNPEVREASWRTIESSTELRCCCTVTDMPVLKSPSGVATSPIVLMSTDSRE